MTTVTETLRRPPRHQRESPFAVTLAAALVVDLLIVAAIVRDWRTRGRPHAAYVVGGAGMLTVQLLRKPFAHTPLWQWITDGLPALALKRWSSPILRLR